MSLEGSVAGSTFFPASLTGTTTFASGGTFSTTGKLNLDTVPSAVTGRGTFGYDAATGRITMNRTGITENLSGAVSPDGRCAVVSGGQFAGNSHIMWILTHQ